MSIYMDLTPDCLIIRFFEICNMHGENFLIINYKNIKGYDNVIFSCNNTNNFLTLSVFIIYVKIIITSGNS